MALQVDIFPPLIAPAKNPVVFQISADPGSPLKLNHKIGLKVYRREDSTDVLIFEDLVSPYYAGGRAIALFEISELLLAGLETTFTLNVGLGLHKVLQTKMLLPYYIKYYEVYGEPATATTAKTSNWFYSLNGGIPPWKHASFYKTYGNFTWFLTSTGKTFLTWYQYAKLTDINAPERLYFVVPETRTEINFSLQVTRHYFADGDDDPELFTIGHSLLPGQAYEFDVSYQALIGSHTGNFSGYSVKVISADEIYSSQEYSFLMDYRELPNLRYFMFLNSLGAFELVRLTGEASFDLAYTRQTFEQTSLELYSDTSASKGQITPDIKRTIKVNTGWIYNQEAEWMQDFISSPQVYEIRANKAYPVIITQDKVELKKDSNYLNSISIEMEYVDLPTVFQDDAIRTWEDVEVVAPPYEEA